MTDETTTLRETVQEFIDETKSVTLRDLLGGVLTQIYALESECQALRRRVEALERQSAAPSNPILSPFPIYDPDLTQYPLRPPTHLPMHFPVTCDASSIRAASHLTAAPQVTPGMCGKATTDTGVKA
jgi:hypothetical protein